MDLSSAIMVAAVAVYGFVTFIYILSLIGKDASIMDIAWGLGFIVATIAVSWQAVYELDMGHFVLMYLVAIWGFRLAIHIFLRKIGKPEDWRYAQWRKDWPMFWLTSYFKIFLLQGTFLLIIASPIMIAFASENFPLVNEWVIFGIAIWAIGFFFEAVGDWQLGQFIKEKKNGKHGKDDIMQSGLWKYTRHPNYFGEMTQWWGIWFMVATLPYGLYAIISPLTITYLLAQVSGVPMLEKKYAKNKQFIEYKKRTNKLIPMPPKKV